MLLTNVNIIGEGSASHIYIEDGRIRNIVSDKASLPSHTPDLVLQFDNSLVFQGLINSHDHLDFDLFPKIGNRIYKNYIEWGADIQTANKDVVNEILKIPVSLRIKWGLYKNLLAGVTTVVHHGNKLTIDDRLINVFQECQSIHSVDRERSWKLKLNRVYRRKEPVVVHIGEGTDESAGKEIDQLLKWNFFKRDIVGVHGVAMTEKQASSFKALVWCPESNDFLLGKTAAVDFLKKKTSILFGTDSTLTAPWNIWEQLRLARGKHLLTDKELFDVLTMNAAKAWAINDIGRLAENQWADIVIAKKKGLREDWDNFYGIDPSDLLLILHRGQIRLFDSILFNQVKNMNIQITEFSKITISGVGKYVRGNLPALMNDIKKYNPDIIFPVEPG